jgi:ribonuclease HI
VGSSLSRTAVFAALAQGMDLPQVRQRFRLTPAELQELFREVAAHYQAAEESFWRLHCDGAARGNPGPAAAGIVLYNPQGEIKAQIGKFLGETTNNVAEYQALLLGLKKARQLGASRIRIFADSELMVRQITGRYQVKSPHLLQLWRLAQKALSEFEAHVISHVPREENAQADALARQAIDQKLSSG